MQTRTVTTWAGDTTIREWGQPTHDSGKLLLALHPMDIDSSGAVFDDAVEPLADAGYYVVAPDLPGFGLTAPLQSGEYAVAPFGDRLWTLLDALIDALGCSSRITLAGQGWGAHLAAEVASQWPPRIAALVLIDGGYFDQPDTAPDDVALTLEQWLDRAREVRSRWPDDAPGLASADALGAAAFAFSSYRVSQTWPAIAAERIPVLLTLATEPSDVGETNLKDAHAFQQVVPQVDIRPARGATHRMVQDVGGGLGLFMAEWLASAEG